MFTYIHACIHTYTHLGANASTCTELLIFAQAVEGRGVSALFRFMSRIWEHVSF
jgi:hypothetical protein